MENKLADFLDTFYLANKNNSEIKIVDGMAVIEPCQTRVFYLGDINK